MFFINIKLECGFIRYFRHYREQKDETPTYTGGVSREYLKHGKNHKGGLNASTISGGDNGIYNIYEDILLLE